jgi:hypothetical protein
VIDLPLLWRGNEGEVGKPHVEQNVKECDATEAQ